MHLHQLPHGWEVVTARGLRLAAFNGAGSKRRAMRYLRERAA